MVIGMQVIAFTFMLAVGGYYDRDASQGQVICYLVILLAVCVVAYITRGDKSK
jgi:hypothetical protein